MRGRIGFEGIGVGGGVTVGLHGDIDVAAGQQANFTGYDKLACLTTTEGIANLFGGTAGTGKVLGVFTDCSPKGDTGTVETKGFVWVWAYSMSGIAVGDFVTPDTAHPGGVKEATTLAFGTSTYVGGDHATFNTERVAGIWQVTALDTVNNKVLIKIDDRL